jgi:hypothetical protein
MAESDTEDKIGRKIGFASQNISDLSQLSLAVAIGLFGILAISVGIDQVLSENRHTSLINLDLMRWEGSTKIILSVAYFGLFLVGAACIVWHKFFSMVQEKYIVEHYKDYLDDLKEVANVNRYLRLFTRSLTEKIGTEGWLKKGFKWTIILILFPYSTITVALWVVIILL